jgi:carbon-monoxide dehydrogenase large subunit
MSQAQVVTTLAPPEAAAEAALGVRLRRKEDPKLITGKGAYVDDIKLPGMLYGAVYRSPYAHARLRGVTTEAASRAGATLSLTREEVVPRCKPIPVYWLWPADTHVPKHYPVAVDKVRYVGEPVAFVVAPDRYSARDAAERIEADYEPLAPVLDLEGALTRDAPRVHEEFDTNQALYFKKEGGDVERALREADVVVRERLLNQRITGAPMEPRGVLASYEPLTGELTVWLSTQIPHHARRVFSELLGVPMHRVRVIAPDVGGGFGLKGQIYPEDLLAALASMQLGRPVKWIEERREHFLGTTHARDHIQDLELGMRRDGRITALKGMIYADLGAYLGHWAPGIPVSTVWMAQGPYAIPNLRVELRGIFTNTMYVDAYRGAGRPEATYLLERLIDEAARELRLDPAEVRFQNFIPPEAFPFKTLTGLKYDSGDYAKALHRLLELADYRELRAQQVRERGQGRYVGLGLTVFTEIAGWGPSPDAGDSGLKSGAYESAVVRVDIRGTVTVYTSSSPHGQGHETTWSQLAAAEFGLRPDDITVIHGDTALCPPTIGTFASRSAAVGGTALVLAARKVKAKALRIAAHKLDVPEDQLEYRAGRVQVRGQPQRALTLAQLAELAYYAHALPPGEEPGLEAGAYFDPANFTYPFGAHLCLAEVDRETGKVRIRQYVCVDDAGHVINPLLVEGQIHGGMAQGIAQALYEEVVYDANGQLLTNTFGEYAMPTAVEVPDIVTDRTVTPTYVNPLGIKGIGETATLAATPAVVNAVADALAPLGVRIREMPLKPEKVWRLLNAARA